MGTWDSPATAIGTLVTAAAAIGAVWVAYHGLQDTAQQLRGTTIYNVAKDGKALQKRYLEKQADPDEVMSYFYSVYRLYTSHVLDDGSWIPIRGALCRFSKDTTIQDVPQWWASHKGLYEADFRSEVDMLLGEASCQP
jgi:hypothetical protein